MMIYLFTWIYLIGVFLLLWLPTILAANSVLVKSNFFNPIFLLSAAGFTLLFYGILGLSRSRTIRIVGLLVLAAIAVIRFLYLGLVSFSGIGFTTDFFVHLQWRSVQLAAQEYPFIFFGGIFAVSLILLLGYSASSRLKHPARWMSLLIIMIASVSIISVNKYTPENELAATTYRWFTPVNLHLPKERVALWQASPYIETNIINKSQLRVIPANKPLNIIVLYLESVGATLLTLEKYPDLMPNLRKLYQEHSLTQDYMTSGYVTIEGMVNSQCGTLFPFSRGSDALASSEGMAENLVCFADILKAAGYQQTYMGGAELGFAKKGDFLLAHGFDTALGQDEWVAQGIYPEADGFGISDSKLFDLSFSELKKLRASGKPYNLTLLTIGTHIPGYRYNECKKYSHSKNRFIQALHCTDQLLAQWLEQLRAQGELDDTLVVITADHHIFSSPEMIKTFGTEITENRHLPFIVLDPRGSLPTAVAGASYDLAPTLLQLLSIEHNNKFILGRSLINGEPAADYIFKRFADDYHGKERGHGYCESNDPLKDDLSAPLSACERTELTRLLGALARGMSSNYVALECNRSFQTKVLVAPEQESFFQFLVDGRDQQDGFVLGGRPLKAQENGLYVVVFNTKGIATHRLFFPANELPNSLQELKKYHSFIAVAKGELILAPDLPSEHGVRVNEDIKIWIGINKPDGIDWLDQMDTLVTKNGWQLSANQCQAIIKS